MRTDFQLVEMPEMTSSRPNARGLKLRDQFYETYRAVERELQDVRIRGLLDALFRASCRRADFWEGQFKRAEKALNGMLASDLLPDELRGKSLSTIHSTRHDAKLLSDVEVELIASFRLLSTQGRSAVRQMVKWASQSGDARER